MKCCICKQTKKDYYLLEPINHHYNFKELDKAWTKYENYSWDYFVQGGGFYPRISKEEAWEEYDYINICTMFESGFIDLKWEDEYKDYLEYCSVLECKLLRKDYHSPWFNSESDIKVRNKVYGKKKKYDRDNKSYNDKSDPWSKYRDSYGKMKYVGVGFRFEHRGQFKHKRADKQYDNYFTAFEEEDVELDYDNFYEEFVYNDWYYEDEDENNEFLSELSMDQYRTDFYWEDALDQCSDIRIKVEGEGND